MFYGCLSNNSREVRQAREGCWAGFNVKPQRRQSSQRRYALTRDHESRRGRESPGGDWRGVPFRPCEQARGRKSGPAPTRRVSRPAGHEIPPAAGHENDRFAVCTKKERPSIYVIYICVSVTCDQLEFVSIHFPPVSCRPKAVSCPREAGLSCPASDGTRRVAEGRGSGGRRSLTAVAPPNANRRSRSIAQPVFVVPRSAPAPYFADFADFARDNQPRTISTQSRKERRARKGGKRFARPRKPAWPGIAWRRLAQSSLSVPASKLAAEKETRANPSGSPTRRTRNPACGGTRKRPLRGLHEKRKT